MCLLYKKQPQRKKSVQLHMWVSVWIDLLLIYACTIVLTQRQWPFLLQKVLSALRSVLSADIFTGCSHALHSGFISICIWHPDLHCFPFTLQLHHPPPLSSTSLLTNSDSYALLFHLNLPTQIDWKHSLLMCKHKQYYKYGINNNDSYLHVSETEETWQNYICYKSQRRRGVWDQCKFKYYFTYISRIYKT